jgi:hypothetical protein
MASGWVSRSFCIGPGFSEGKGIFPATRMLAEAWGLSEKDELAAGCRPNPQAGSLRYLGSAAILAAG